MILSSLTIQRTSNPAAGVVLGEAGYSFVSGQITGYTITDVSMQPAPTVLRSSHMPHSAGGVVASGHADLRDVSIAGTILASSQHQANDLRRSLAAVCGDPGSDTISIIYATEGVEMALVGYVERVEFRVAGAYFLEYTITFRTGDPYAHSTAGSAVTASVGSSASTVGVMSHGDVSVFPTISLDVTGGTVTGFVIRNTTTGEQLTVAGISAASGSTIAVKTRPGYETISQDGSSIFSKRVIGSSWPTVAGGANTFSVVTTGGSATLTIAWSDGWSA